MCRLWGRGRHYSFRFFQANGLYLVYDRLYRRSYLGAISSVGRASRLHREGRRFEPVIAHHHGKERHSDTIFDVGYFSAARRQISIETLREIVSLRLQGAAASVDIRVDQMQIGGNLGL